ncbi:hypothetical protein ACVWYG_000122 [Pedobacter sp. UYEF25]
MKNSYVLYLWPIILFSCGRKTEMPTGLKPVYADFKNAWQEKNLYGKVKEIETYKTVFQKDHNDDKAIITLKEKFTDFGSVKEIFYFDVQGILTESNHLEYDETHFNNKTTSKNKPTNTHYTITSKRDTINKTEKKNILINNSSQQTVTIYLNDKGKIVKQVDGRENDSIVSNTIYRLNGTGKIISETQLKGNNKEPVYVAESKYTKKGELVGYSYKFMGTTRVSEIEWKNGYIFKIRIYTVSRDLIKQMDEETKYDQLYNPIDVKIYNGSKLIRESKFAYVYDSHGNWNKRDVSMKTYAPDQKKFSSIYNETREIKYW